MKKTVIITAIVAVVVIVGLILFNKLTNKEDLAVLYADVKSGEFQIIVTTTGELLTENSTEIRGPELMGGRNMRISDIQIQDLVPEGTIVKEGDYVATLDRTILENSLKDELDRLETMENSYQMKILDTTLSLGDFRDNLRNLKFNMEEAEITLEQSKYEPPTTIRQNTISLEKASRSYEQALKSYELKIRQTRADIRKVELDLQRQRDRITDTRTLLEQFVVRAPAPGMVIYKRDWGGTKRKVGSTIRPNDPVVATLPDLSTMVSRTYVNEIDVSKVKMGQSVTLTVDAFPEKSFTGEVISVANIGEQLPNTDAKVFEVVVKLDAVDPILRPSMTTGNKIITSSFPDVLYIPLECIYATPDSIPYVYTKDGHKQVVVLGESNEDQIIVEQGLKAGEVLHLLQPANSEAFKLTGEELIATIKERARIKREEEERIRMEGQQNRMNGNGGNRMQMTPEQMERMMQMRGNREGGQTGEQTGGQRPPGQGQRTEGGVTERSN
jgi:multidrug efflux pump subunit AcrA (membrane-fusion protein)